MRGFWMLGAALVGCVLSGPGEALPMRAFERVVPANHALKIDRVIIVDRNCRPMEPSSLTLLEPATYGEIRFTRSSDYPTFPEFNPRAKCNGRKLPSTSIIYSPAPGFTGEDTVAIEFTDAFGAPSRIRYHIVVR